MTIKKNNNKTVKQNPRKKTKNKITQHKIRQQKHNKR